MKIRDFDNYDVTIVKKTTMLKQKITPKMP